MTSRDFCFWLQGYFEVAAADGSRTTNGLDPKQVEVIQRHLALVFKHEIDPSMPAPSPKTPHEKKLDEKHDPLAHMRPHGHGDLVMRC